MPASTEPAFGQVWRYRGAGTSGLWMLVAPERDDLDLGYWTVLYLSASRITLRVKAGYPLLDRMAGLPDAAREYVDAGWERVS
jgi:hypothetical protein